MGKLDQLTGLRYFAALLVFLSHLEWKGSNEALVQIFNSGYVGVSFFFILSGFVLSYSYGEKIYSHDLRYIKYVLLRLARLTPLHFLSAIPYIFLDIYKSEFHLPNTLFNLLYLQSWIPNSNYYFSLNSPSWSLSNEMFFYIVFFLLVFLSKSNLFKTFLILFITILFSATIVEHQFSDLLLFDNTSFSHWLFYIFPLFRLLEFIVGMLLFKAWQRNYRITKLLIIPSYILLFVSMYFARFIPESFRMSLYFLPFITLFFYSHLTENSLVYRFFKLKCIVILGNSSFAFYLIHKPLITIIKKFTSNFNLSNFTFSIIALIIISIISIIIHFIFEQKTEMILKNYIIKNVK